MRKMTASYELYPPKKVKKGDGDEESREDKDNTGTSEVFGWSTRMSVLPSFNPQMGSKQSRRP